VAAVPHPEDRSEPHDDAGRGEMTEVARRCFTNNVNSGVERAPGGTIYQDERWIAEKRGQSACPRLRRAEAEAACP
jgi:hypothetical protein